jgi:allophanate hydrolase
MTRQLRIVRAGPGVTVQDLGRPGFLAQGLSCGGAADTRAMAEGAALLGQSVDLAALEISPAGLEVVAEADLWIALTGAPMRAQRDGHELLWSASHPLAAGDRLRIGAPGAGTYAYLHVAGGIDLPMLVGGRGAHLAAGLGAPVEPGQVLPVGADDGAARIARGLAPEDRFSGGTIRMMPGPQTGLFPADLRERFLATPFRRTAWANRQGVRLGFDGAGLRPEAGLNLVSEAIVPGDVQITGDGTPYVLGPECQTIGGYPRIGTILPQDLPLVMQALPGSKLRFQMVTPEAALAGYQSPHALARSLSGRVRALVRDLHHVPNLLAYNFISGVTAGTELSETEANT